MTAFKRLRSWLIAGGAVLVLLLVAHYCYLRVTSASLPTPHIPGPIASATPPPLVCDSGGDSGNYADTPRVMNRLRPESREAFLVLANARAFCSELVTSAAILAEPVGALRQLAQDPLADAAFKELVTSATPASQLYGLVGLSYSDRDAFALEAQRHAAKGDLRVHTVLGCEVGSTPISQIASEWIAEGDWPHSLRGKTLDRRVPPAAEKADAPVEARS